MRKLFFALMCVLIIVSCAKKPTVNQQPSKTVSSVKETKKESEESGLLTPVPPDKEEKEMIKKAVEFHDNGRYKDAIELFKKVLEKNPDNVVALGEISYTYFEMGDYDTSLKYALKASRYKSEMLPYIYVSIGNIYDIKQKPEKALEYYKKSLEIFPEYDLAYFNIAVFYLNKGNIVKARECLKKTLDLNPYYPSAHFYLGEIYYQDGYNIPSLLAFARFIIIESATERSDFALERIKKIVSGNVKSENSKEATIFFNPKEPKYDGDFSDISLAFLLKKAELLSNTPPKNDLDRLTNLYDFLFSIMADVKKDKGFVWNFYAPYFIELREKGFVKPFVIQLYFRDYPQAVEKWFKSPENDKLYKDFIKWDENFKFKKLGIKPCF